MKTNLFSLAVVLCLATARAAETAAAPKENVFAARPLGLQVSVKMVGPYMEPADLQIICLFQHKAGGDTYIGAAKDTDAHLNGLLSALRNRGEFVGELGETFLFTPAAGTIPAKRFLVIGLGEEKALSLATLEVVGRLAAREAVRLQAQHVAWAPVIRDQGNSTIEVGAGDRAFVSQFLAAYDTELRLQAQGLAPQFKLASVVIEAGPSYFDSAVKQVGAGLETTVAELARRDATPYCTTAQ